jgi:anti-sigma B factor antagonist
LLPSGGNTRAVPLYACDRCGFTSAAFRVDAARAHRLAYPQCSGTIQIIFRSDERHRDQSPIRRRATAGGAAAHAQRERTPGTRPGAPFTMQQQIDTDGAVRLTLLGNLDLAVAQTLTDRLGELCKAGRHVRLDLSQLAFIDSSGVGALLLALTDARWNAWPLEVDRHVSPSVERAARIVGIARVLWPRDPASEHTDSSSHHISD